MTYFAYVKNQQSFCALTVTPQIIHDEMIAAYKQDQRTMVIIGDKYPLTADEANLPINELIIRFPPPDCV
jgi:hypothetical protein